MIIYTFLSYVPIYFFAIKLSTFVTDSAMLPGTMTSSYRIFKSYINDVRITKYQLSYKHEKHPLFPCLWCAYYRGFKSITCYNNCDKALLYLTEILPAFRVLDILIGRTFCLLSLRVSLPYTPHYMHIP